MWLLFLLVFNSATPFDSEDFNGREVATKFTSTLRVICWPSLLLAEASNSPESQLRSWSLLSEYRYLNRKQRVDTFLNNDWWITESTAAVFREDLNSWVVFTTTIKDSYNYGTLLITYEGNWLVLDLNKGEDFWSNNSGISPIVACMNSCKKSSNFGWLWP